MRAKTFLKRKKRRLREQLNRQKILLKSLQKLKEQKAYLQKKQKDLKKEI